MRRLRLALALTASAGVAAACSSFGSTDTAGADAGDAPDASGAPADAAPGDGGAARSPGPCAPEVVASGAGTHVVSLVAVGTNLLWMTSTGAWASAGDLLACPKSGCAAATTLVANEDTGDLASDGTAAFASWVYGNRRLAAINPALEIAEVEPMGVAHKSAVKLQMRGGDLFFLSLYDEDGGAQFHQIVRRDASEHPVTTFSGTATLFATTADRVLLAQSGYGDITQCPQAGCAQLSPFVVGADATSLAATDEGVFWTRDGMVYGCAAPAGAPPVPCAATTVVLSASALGKQPATFVEVAGGALFVATEAGDLFRCEPSRCAETVAHVAHDTEIGDGSIFAFQSHAVVEDADAFYWTATDHDADGGFAGYRIMKLRK